MSRIYVPLWSVYQYAPANGCDLKMVRAPTAHLVWRKFCREYFGPTKPARDDYTIRQVDESSNPENALPRTKPICREQPIILICSEEEG
jgi:hypothetical protein